MADKMGSKDLGSIFDPLKPNLTKETAILLEDIFKSILEDMGFTASSSSVTAEGLLESISESLLGKHFTGPPETSSVSRIASFVASDIVDSVLDKLHSTTQTMYSGLLPENGFIAGCKESGQAGPTVLDLASGIAQTPPSSDLVNGVAEEMVQMITDKLELFVLLSEIKLTQFKLLAETKAVGVLQERLFAATPPCSILSEVTVKGAACTPNSKTVSSSEKKILQCVEDVINSVLSYILKQMSQKGLLPPRESSVLLQLMNDVSQSFRGEKLKRFSLRNSLPGVPFENFPPPVQCRVDLKMQGGLSDCDTQPPTLITKEVRKPPCPSINCPGMAIFEEQDEAKTQPSRTISSVTREQKVLVMEDTQGQAKSPQRWGDGHESFPQGREMFLETEPKSLEKAESGLENLVQDPIFTLLDSKETAAFPAGHMPDIGQPTKARSCIMCRALKEMEENFLEEELPLVVEMLQKLFTEISQQFWADQPMWTPDTPPLSCAHLTINRHQQVERAASKEHIQVNSQTLISDTELNTFASRLVKTIFQKLALAILADADSSRSKHSFWIITSALPVEVAADHVSNPAMSSEGGTAKGGPQPAAEGLSKGNQPQTHCLLTKTNLACDLVETCLAKVYEFVAAKAEPQLGSCMQSLSIFAISDAASTGDQDVKKVTVSQKRASRLEKVFRALSCVFSRTSPRKRDRPVTGHLKPATD